jgi:hypothetical protein
VIAVSVSVNPNSDAQLAAASRGLPWTRRIVAFVSHACALRGARASARSRSWSAASNSCRFCRIVARRTSTAIGGSAISHHGCSAACAQPL